jgi:large subunit ribosomal protein L4
MAELKEKIFNQEANSAVVFENLRWFLASQRQGTHSAKTRTEVSGGGIKPWKQKGTGRARAGSIRSPLWRGGGVIFPPKPRDYSYGLPKKVRKIGLRILLSDFNRENRIKVIDAFSIAETKTKAGVKYLADLGLQGKILIVLPEALPNFDRAIRNIKGVKVVLSKNLNIFDLLKAESILIDKKSIAQLEERLN